MNGCPGPVVENRGLCCSDFTVGEPEIDDPFIAAMLIELEETGHFSCVFWRNGLCEIHDKPEYPAMCRAYPEPGKVCRFCGGGQGIEGASVSGEELMA